MIFLYINSFVCQFQLGKFKNFFVSFENVQYLLVSQINGLSKNLQICTNLRILILPYASSVKLIRA